MAQRGRASSRIEESRARDVLRVAIAAEDAASTQEAAVAARAVLDLRDEMGPAAEHFLATDVDAALMLLGATPSFWMDAGLTAQGRDLTERAIAAARGRPSASLGKALLAAAELAFRQGDQAVAADRARRAIDVAGPLGDRRTVSVGYADLARVAYRDGDGAEIERCAARALDAAGDDPMGRRNALHMLAWAAHTRGDFDEALRRFETSLEYRRQLGSPLSIAVELGNIGTLALERGNLADGARTLTESLETARTIGSTYLVVNSLPSFVMVARMAGELDNAAVLIGASRAIATAAGIIPDPGVIRVQVEAELERVLGGERCEALIARGAGMAEASAVELALDVARRIAR